MSAGSRQSGRKDEKLKDWEQHSIRFSIPIFYIFFLYSCSFAAAALAAVINNCKRHMGRMSNLASNLLWSTQLLTSTLCHALCTFIFCGRHLTLIKISMPEHSSDCCHNHMQLAETQIKHYLALPCRALSAPCGTRSSHFVFAGKHQHLLQFPNKQSKQIFSEFHSRTKQIYIYNILNSYLLLF